MSRKKKRTIRLRYAKDEPIPGLLSHEEFRFRYDPPEKEVQVAIIDYLLKRGYVVMRVNTTTFVDEDTKRPVKSYYVYGLDEEVIDEGCPDLLALKGHGTWVEAHLLEVKRPSGRVRASQKKFANLAGLRGIPCHAVRSAADVHNILPT